MYEPPRVSRRLHCLGESESWEEKQVLTRGQGELCLNLVDGRPGFGFWVNSVLELDSSDDIGQVLEAAQSSPSSLS